MAERKNLDPKKVVAAWRRNKKNKAATADELGCSSANVTYWLRKQGLEEKPKRQPAKKGR